MSRAIRLWPLLTALQRYEKTISTRNLGHGQFIEAPILAYLIETPNGRILYDVGCDYAKIADPELRARYLDPMRPRFEPPRMDPNQRIPAYLARLGLSVADIDLVFVGHLHFDHAGGLCEVPGCEVHVQAAELAAARAEPDNAIMAEVLAAAASGAANPWKIMEGEYTVAPGVQALASPGHTAGHMSMFIELPQGPPVILCGDAADLQENLDAEIAPGYCWNDQEATALASIRRLKSLAIREKAQLWPNHDLAFYRALPQFPAWRD